MAIGSPKFRMVFGPFYNTELFVGAGMGYHSNDARSTVITEVPRSRAIHRPAKRVAISGALARRRGRHPHQGHSRPRQLGQPVRAASGFRIVLRRRYRRNHAGPAEPAHRRRVHQRLSSGVVDPYRRRSRADPRALSRLRRGARGALPVARRLSAGADRQCARQLRLSTRRGWWRRPASRSARPTGWFGDLRWRYISSRPLTEDGAFQSPPLSIFNGQVGYRFDNGWRIQLDGLNLLNARTDQATYAYGSLLKTDSLFALCNSGGRRPRRRRSARTA